MANTSAILQQAAHTTCQYHLPAAQQEPHKKDSLLTKNAGEFSGTKSREWTISGTNDKPERDRDRKSESRTRQKNEREDRKKV